MLNAGLLSCSAIIHYSSTVLDSSVCAGNLPPSTLPPLLRHSAPSHEPRSQPDLEIFSSLRSPVTSSSHSDVHPSTLHSACAPQTPADTAASPSPRLPSASPRPPSARAGFAAVALYSVAHHRPSVVLVLHRRRCDCIPPPPFPRQQLVMVPYHYRNYHHCS
ncbi:hypothetical protein N657DRAFT_432765 [Parathielavia appendiculata]|uniref:Uncharacterized protein n=1 Tax=Parathielavia appendiculata TaxID=2587402 RepID=A0AAN6U274_9PEZI|nr:hypothetical protein N657DRAFT_432765 [Parathielavia appendiculata]